MLLSLLFSCVVTHVGRDATTATGATAPYGARVVADGAMAVEAVGKADGNTPVRVTSTVRSFGGRSSSITVSVGAPVVGYVQAGINPGLQRQVAEARAYREQWRQNHATQLGPAVSAAGSGSAGSTACPTEIPYQLLTQAQIDACQNQEIDSLTTRVFTEVK